MSDPGHAAPAARLEDVLITEELARRASRPADHEAENRALVALAEAMAARPESILQQLAETALRLCRADSAGVSVLEPGGGPGVFHWPAVAGAWARYAGGGLPREAIPCGAALDRDAPLLFALPGRHFPALAQVEPPLVEALVVPFRSGGRPVGTVWANAHSRQRRFDAEDARLLRGLSHFASAAYQVASALRRAAASEALEQSEQRYRLLATVSGQTVWSATADFGKVVPFAGEDPFGPGEPERAGGGWLEAVHPDDREGVRAAVEAAVRAKSPLEIEHPLRTPAGSYRHFVTRAVPLLDERGGIREWVGTSADVTEGRRAEEALRQSEERFRLMVQTVKDYAIFLMDDAGNVASWNEGAERILGYREEEVLGRSGSLFFTPEDRRAGLFERELRTAAAEGRASDENWSVRKDGSRFWASGVSTALRDAQGRLRGFAKIFRDLTEQKAAEDALREKELRLRVALSAAMMGTWHWDIAADRQGLDESLRRMVGLPAGEGALEQFLAAVHPDDRAAVREAFARSVREGVGLDAEFRVLRPDGSVRWLKDKGDIFRGPDGRPLYLTGACVDITDRKGMEEELRRRAEELREADRRKDEFLAMLGHELRNPLAPLRGVMEALRRQQLDERAQGRAYDMIERQVSHLSRLVDDLLDVSRIIRGMVELRKAPVELARITDQAVEMASPTIEGRGHELTVALPRTPLRVEGDETRLTQILFNLLDNAAKYTEPGGRIWLEVGREGGRAAVRVRDNGTGMAADLVPKAFDLFTQGQRSPDRSQGGLGLGLTLVKRLTLMHGGTVEAHSDGPGRGSEFVVRLPALPAETPAGPAPLPPAARAPAARVARALVVDDNPDVAESLVWMLEGLAAEVRMAHNGPAALEAARAFRPEVVLCDIGLPGMDGYEVCRRLRAMPGLEKALIAAVSGYGGEEDRQRSKEAGFDRHLVKPIGRATVEELIGAARAEGGGGPK